MEQAVFITRVENLKYVSSEYSRLYFGNEFCQRLLPSLDDLEAVLDFVARRQMRLSLVTPYVTDEAIDALRPLFKRMSEGVPGSEIVINDWGIFRLITNEFGWLNLVLGRLLTKQKRGPRILCVKDKVPPEMLEHFKKSNIDVPVLSDFLLNNRISRVELDNLLQGIVREGPFLKASLYFPFAYVTTTRFCLTGRAERNGVFSRSISSCDKECRRYAFKLRHKNMPAELFLKGNTQFFENRNMPDNLGELNIDRIVYEPEIPV